MLTSVGTIGTFCSTNRGDVPRQEPRGVFNAVDSGVQHVVEDVLAEAVRGDPCALVMGSADRVPDSPWPETTAQGRRRRGRSSRPPA